MKIVILLFMGIFLPASTAHAAPMSQQEIQKELVGKTLQFRTSPGSTGKVRYYRNGKAKLWGHDAAPRADKGTWQFKRNKVCATWKKVRNGREACFSATRLPGFRYRTSIGTMFWRQ